MRRLSSARKIKHEGDITRLRVFYSDIFLEFFYITTLFAGTLKSILGTVN